MPILDWTDIAWRAGLLAIVAAITLLVQYVVIKALRRVLKASDVPSATIFLNIVRAILWSFALLFVLEPVFGVQPTAFIAALGVTSVALSLGLQDTISNVIAGLGLMLGRVIKPQDNITVGDVSGVVTDMTWRSSMVRTRDGKVQVIPNSVLNKTALTQRTRWDVTNVEVPVLVRPGADLDAVTQDIQSSAQEALAGRLDSNFDVEVRFSGLEYRGSNCVVHIHIADDQSAGVCADLLARSLANKTWLASAMSDTNTKGE